MPTRAAPARADPFDGLNDEQRHAVFHGRDAGAAGPPPLLVIAGAGSGKTLTLAARVARLVLDGADPQRILLLTFSRRAAQSLQRRVGRLLHQALGFARDAAAARPALVRHLPRRGRAAAARLRAAHRPEPGLHHRRPRRQRRPDRPAAPRAGPVEDRTRASR